ncbi:MAG: tripartite tricarboxylate transporter TctB family protein [Firmicutes bacterium]|nr:tripartite tricarboxylate transporter TctB family protein [Bacillota bacterium]
MRRKDIYSAIGVMCIAAFFLLGTAFMPWKGVGFTWYSAPGLVPAILAFLLFLSGLLLFLRALFNRRFYARLATEETGGPPVEDDGQEVAAAKDLPPLLQSERWRVILVFALCAVYIFLLIGRLNYILATTIYMAAFIWIFKGGEWYKSLLVGLATAVAVWALFYKVFAVILP